jgi:hypothetical protein
VGRGVCAQLCDAQVRRDERLERGRFDRRVQLVQRAQHETDMEGADHVGVPFAASRNGQWRSRTSVLPVVLLACVSGWNPAHMCSSEFDEIMEHIARLDADVLSIEASRSDMKVLNAFAGNLDYPNEIGPGVYDIHSPRVPPLQEIERLLALAEERIERDRLWVNPDCGLKTRRWEEVLPALEHMWLPPAANARPAPSRGRSSASCGGCRNQARRTGVLTRADIAVSAQGPLSDHVLKRASRPCGPGLAGPGSWAAWRSPNSRPDRTR